MSVNQTEFRAAILDADRDVPLGLIDQNGTQVSKRFDVYRNNVAVSLTEALKTGFPVIAKLLGEANFKPIAGVYLRQSPPQSPLMMHYGADFPAFLRAFPALQKLGYLGDVAEVELALRRAYHAADVSPIAAETLFAFAPDALITLRFSIAPSVQLLRSSWPIYDLWAYNSLPNHPRPSAGAQDVAIFRPEFDPKPHLLPPGCATFIEALASGDTLGEAAETASTAAAGFDLSQALSLLLSNGALTEFQDKDD